MPRSHCHINIRQLWPFQVSAVVQTLRDEGFCIIAQTDTLLTIDMDDGAFMINVLAFGGLDSYVVSVLKSKIVPEPIRGWDRRVCCSGM